MSFIPKADNIYLVVGIGLLQLVSSRLGCWDQTVTIGIRADSRPDVWMNMLMI